MRIPGLVFGILLAALQLAPAQITVEVELDQDQFLPNEAIIAAVRVTNRSGQTLNLGDTPDWLKLAVEGRDAFVVKQLDLPDVKGEFTLGSSMVATKRVNLTPCFDMARAGRYSVIATVRIPGWQREFTSPPKTFDVIDGRKLWEQEVGVPTPPGEEDRQPELRRFALQQANYLKQLRLYVRLTDSSGARVLRVFALGPMVSFDQPVPQVDRQSRLHVLFQAGARSFLYCVVDTDGELVVRQTYDYTNTRPTLRVDEEGNYRVVGGARRVTERDVPPPSAASSTVPAVPSPDESASSAATAPK